MRMVSLMALLVLLSGCASVTVQTPDGFVLKRSSWVWANSKVASVEIGWSSNGVRTLKMEGYQQDNVENIPAIIGAATAGAIQGYKAANGGAAFGK